MPGRRLLEDTKIKLRVVKACAEDLVDLSNFIKPFVDSGDLLPRTFDELEDLLDTSFIARLDGVIVGCAALEIYSKKLCEIRSLAVDPGAQGLGIGKQLVAACVDLALQEGIYEIMAISVAEDFFKSCGFDFHAPQLEKSLLFANPRLALAAPLCLRHENRGIDPLSGNVPRCHVGEHDVEGARARLAGLQRSRHPRLQRQQAAQSR